jgi:hypothetical protein
MGSGKPPKTRRRLFPVLNSDRPIKMIAPRGLPARDWPRLNLGRLLDEFMQ